MQPNALHFWTSHVLPGISLMRAEFRAYEPALHRSGSLVLAATEAGAADADRTRDAGAGRLFLISPGEAPVGRMERQGPGRWRYLHARSADPEVASADPGARSPNPSGPDLLADAELARRLLALRRLLANGGDARQLEERFISLTAALSQLYGAGHVRRRSPPKDHALVARIIDWMRSRLEEPVRLQHIASAFDMSQFRLIRLFNKTLGITPHSCLTQLRLDAACELLGSGVPAAEVAPSVGFYDQSALGWHFKRSLGLTPNQFAQAIRQ